MPIERNAYLWGPTMSPSSKAIAVIPLIVLACIGMLSFWSEVRNEENRAWVRHTYLVVEKLQDIRIDITQAESGQRGFMLTGQDAYLQLYSAGVSQVHQNLNDLTELISDNPVERMAIQRLDPLIAARLDELNGGIDARENSGLLAGAEAVTKTDSGGTWMGQIAVQIGEMRHTEDQLLLGRLDAAEASARRIRGVIVYGN